MTSFVIRKIDPDFWAKVRAKAALEGVTVKDVILRLLAQWVAAVVLLSLSVGCGYHAPSAPTAIAAIADSEPYTLAIGSFSESGSTTITAKVQNVKGAPLAGIAVQFTTDAGELSEATVLTNAVGSAATTLTAASAAVLTVRAGSMTRSTLVALASPVAPPPLVPTPAPAPTPSPTPPGPFGVTLSTAGDVTVGSQTVFRAQVSGSAVRYTWTFGDGGITSGTSPTTAYTYAAAGSYLAAVRVSDALGRTVAGDTTVTVRAIPVVTPPVVILAASMVCAPALSGTLCNVSATYGGAALAASSITQTSWDWGDGTLLETRVPPTAPLGQHNYPQPGTYTVVVGVTATTVDGAQTASTSKVIVIP